MKTLKILTVVAALLPASVFADLNSGLVAYYNFDGNGNNSAGPGLNLNGNAISYQPGLFGQAAAFNGQNSYFTSPDNVPITGNQSRSIDVWLNPSSFTGRGNIVGWGPAQTAGDSFATYLLDPSVGQTWATFYFRDHSSGPSPFSYSFGQWLNLGVVYDGTANTVKFYINGTDVGTYVSYGSDQTPVNTVASPLLVGYFTPQQTPGTDPWFTPWNGLMDNLSIYNRALSPDEIQALAAVPEPSAVALAVFGLGAVTLRRKIKS
jgi:arabinan endo-1,5-alpha-L-arabinosidase